jgi:hypothetical protein
MYMQKRRGHDLFVLEMAYACCRLHRGHREYMYLIQRVQSYLPWSRFSVLSPVPTGVGLLLTPGVLRLKRNSVPQPRQIRHVKLTSVESSVQG